MNTRYRGWAAVVLVGVACGAPPSFIGPAADAGTDSSPSVAAACKDLAAAECAELASCSSVLLQTRYGSVATCQTRVAQGCSAALAAPSSGNSPLQVEACAQAYPGWSCSQFLGNVNLPADCAQPTGTLANGAVCAFAAQCKTGFCATPPTAGCGTCAPVPQVGDSCANLSTCGQRLVCLQASHICASLGAAGAACSKEAPCGAHLSCVGSNAARGTLGECRPSAGLAGAACDPTLAAGPGCDYDGGLTCNGQSKACEPLIISAGGGPCDSNNHQFATCAASGTCSTSEAGAEGSCTSAAPDGRACSTAGGGPACMPPARCIVTSIGSTTGTCRQDSVAACK